jgi:UDP-N-acetylmuramoyl-L-alanyl-D-glutamate--2,6-diaminopimelate ligase
MHSAAWTLGRLLDGLAPCGTHAELPIDGLCSDSRHCAPGDLFLAWQGTLVHGLAHLAAAARAGAVAALYDPAGAGEVPATQLPAIPLPGLRGLAGRLADRFHGEPSHALKVIGVTGTNGKTSVCHFLAQAFDAPGTRCGVIGTLGNGLPGALEPATHTTPDALALHAGLARLRDAGATRVALEVSSHALDQERVAGVRFDTAVFTNLTHEHLDYHGDMAGYAAAKRKLFNQPGLRRAALNVDDPQGMAWRAGLDPSIEVLGFGFDPAAELRGSDLRLDTDGLALEVRHGTARATLRSPLLGRFNASNLLATLAVLRLARLDLGEAVARLARVRTVPGRMERFARSDGPLAVVDYAHTPDALEAALAALREHCRGRLWCVFGCGGDRDATKRPLMGAVAEAGADHVIVTDDNPRHEDGAAIAAAIVAGCSAPTRVEVVRDRATAITHALGEAAPEDIVLVAGKGHETVQLVGDEARPFSDRALVRRLQEEAA